MRLLALDQASITSGYAIFENGKLIIYDKFTYDDTEVAKRLVKIRNKIKTLIQDNNIDEVVIEDIQMQNNVVNNVQTFKVLAEVYGVILELVKELNLPYTTVPSTTWKSTLKIKGSDRATQKRNAQQYVVNTYGIKPIQDICDAICIGTHFLSNKKQEEQGFDWSE